MPHRVRDPIVAASAIVAAVQTIVSRIVDPQDSAVVSITAIHGGEAFNVIPDRVEMRGTIRTFSEAVSKSIEAELKRICERTAEALGATASVQRPPLTPYPATVNHHDETEIALGAMRAVSGSERVRDDVRPVMGSEDFAFILRRVPGAYIFVGNGETAGLHNPKYDFNDEAIPYGVSYWTELARRVLPV
jgi:amidohydrolase